MRIGRPGDLAQYGSGKCAAPERELEYQRSGFLRPCQVLHAQAQAPESRLYTRLCQGGLPLVTTIEEFRGRMVLLVFIDPGKPDALFMLFSGGLMLGAVYMATDMVTSPTTAVGAWIYGFGIGALVVIIRLWGGLPEGVMYAILLMNALVPFINRATQPRVFGTGKAVGAHE